MAFRRITIGSGERFILGRDEKTNDELVKEYEGKSNFILHTVAPGSPFCVIENPKPKKEEVIAAAIFTARYSQDWRNNKKDVLVSVFTGKDVKKTKEMKAGTWAVRKAKTIKVKKEDILKIGK